SCNAPPTPALRPNPYAGPPRKTQTPQAGIAFGQTTIEVRNRGSGDWNKIALFINEVAFGYEARISLKAGESGTYSLRDFCKDDGRRFDPSQYRVLKIWIGGDGYDFAAFGH